MFKWTEAVKFILIDIDNIQDEYLNFPYEKYAKYRFFSLDKENRFYISDFLTLLKDVADNYSYYSSEIVCISCNTEIIKEMMRYHVGTIGVSGTKDLGYLTDNYCCSVDELAKIIRKQMASFPAELYAEGKKEIRSLIYISRKCTDKNNEYQIFYGGRYFPKNKDYFSYDALSAHILNFKNRSDPVIAAYYKRAIKTIFKYNDIDLVTYVPLKPSQIENHEFNRFEAIDLPEIDGKKVKYTKVIECRNDFRQKELSFIERKQAVRNSYAITDKKLIENKTVLVLDDIVTTCSTSSAIADILYEAGAIEVLFLVIAVNQMI